MRERVAIWAGAMKTRGLEAWAELDEPPDEQRDEPNPLKMFFFGAVSLFTALAITPSVACGLYPLVTTAEFGEQISTDAAGVFVFVSTMFVAFYKLTSEFWNWQLSRGKERGANYKAMALFLVVLLAVVSSFALGVTCSEGSAEVNDEAVEENAGLDGQD